ncbi:MAG: DUF4041 domain-containing protein [Rhizobiaceae bacterium]|nr:DUF4041 domain-containing protein [Rhizobiaceae bacterium]
MSSEEILTILLMVYLIFTLVFSVLFVIWFIKLQRFKKRFAGVLSAEEEEKSIRARLNLMFNEQKAELLKQKKKVTDVKAEYRQKRQLLSDLEEALKPLEDAQGLADVGFQEPKFQLEDHAEYIFAIKQVKASQKALVRAKGAIVGLTDWTVGDSKSEGKKMIGRTIRMTLRAFNNECDSRINKINWKNVDQVKKRMLSSRDALDKLNESMQVEITDEYMGLKYQEADLVNEEKIKKEQEKERLREARELEREEAKAQREIRAELKRQEAEERDKQVALTLIREKLETASDEHRAALEAEANQLEEDLAAANLSKGRLLSMAEHTRIGHLYVISNRGAFGDGVVKIGMTRRLEPLDRVKELGDASVPFPFDIHAMIFSDDAPKLEKELHNKFDEFRVNKINRRKEFFDVSLEAVQQELSSRIPGVPFEFSSPSMEYAGSLSAADIKKQAAQNQSSSLPSEI